ncbi:MAG: helicase-related protein [Candidatus Melainabacteria bacterium]|jgi:superfamily II DNA helicase RecQ
MVTATISQDEDTIVQQIQGNRSLILISSHKNHSYYSYKAAFDENKDLTLVLMPSSASINREIGFLRSINALDRVAALTSDLFPNQARKLISDIAQGNFKMFFLTPESFLYWFSSGFNSMAVEHYRKLSEDDLGKQVFINSQIILGRISRLVLFDFDLISRKNTVHKPKYLESVNLLRELKKTVLAISSNGLQEVVDDFAKFFPETPIVYDSLRLNNISLNSHFCFSRLDKQKKLLNLINNKKPTIVYVSQNEDLADLVNYLRDKLPNRQIKAFHKGLLPEQRAEALDYFFKDPNPVFITCSNLMDGIHREDLTQLIHYSPPISLQEYYREIHVLTTQKGKKAESHVLFCEDDFIHRKTKSAIADRENLLIDTNKQNHQLLDWLSQKEGCRWQHLEQGMASQQEGKCGICDLCMGQKPAFFGSIFSMLLKNKFRS